MHSTKLCSRVSPIHCNRDAFICPGRTSFFASPHILIPLGIISYSGPKPPLFPLLMTFPNPPSNHLQIWINLWHITFRAQANHHFSVH